MAFNEEEEKQDSNVTIVCTKIVESESWLYIERFLSSTLRILNNQIRLNM
jgi:hypothetical protein